MSVYPVSGKWDLLYFRKVASTAFTANNFVAFEGNGATGDPIEPADASDAALLGIGIKTVASSDATNDRIPVLVPAEKSSELECDTVAGTMVVADEGLDVDLTDAASVNRAATSTGVLRATRFISATKGRFTIILPSYI